ncbi:hypothetical protein CB1_000346004 [Camelus ferus]|nr:hypothetical protein CB1_000346004 [Camelus ferus]
MKGLPCPCPALPHFWQPGSRFMAESSRTQAPGKGPLLSVQLLRAQYEGLRRQQRAQSHLVVLPKGGNMPALAESMINAVWINKERRPSLSLEEVGPEAEGMLEEADQVSLRAPESPWHTQLEVHCLAQTFHQETSHQSRDEHLAGVDSGWVGSHAIGLLPLRPFSVDDTFLPVNLDHFANLLPFVMSSYDLNFIILSDGHGSNIVLLSQLCGKHGKTPLQ